MSKNITELKRNCSGRHVAKALSIKGISSPGYSKESNETFIMRCAVHPGKITRMSCCWFLGTSAVVF